MAIQKGTGFTNLNRIMQANKGNRLGQAVSGGIQGQVAGVKSNVKSAQEQFQEEAEKNRLDTQAAKDKRSGILGRFNEQNYAPDLSKFQVSSGLQTQYQANKDRLSQQKTAQEAKIQQAQQTANQYSQGQDFQAKQTAYNQAVQRQQEIAARPPVPNQGNPNWGSIGVGPGYEESFNANLAVQKAQKDFQAAQAQQKALQDAYEKEQANLAGFDKQSQDIEAGFKTSSDAEKEAFRKAEISRLIAANAPTDQEIKEFTKYRTGTYTGPKELQDATSLFGRAAQAEELGGLTRSEGGRQELLRRFVGGTDYTQGQRQLDTSILGQQPGALGAAARQARGSTELVEGANRQAGALAQEYVGKAKQFGEETTKQIGETKTPLSASLDTRVQEAQKAEEARLGGFKELQDVLSGADKFSGLDQWSRTGLALQEAANRGIISPQDVNMLIGQGGRTGLLQRGANLGLDVNKLIAERFTNQAAQNLGRSGLASAEDIAKLNALDKLAGKQGTDLEFLEGQGKFAAGKTGFNLDSLTDYISKTEAEKARTDKAYADKLAAEQARYMNKTLAGGQEFVGGGAQAGSGILNTAGVLENPLDAGQIAGQSAQDFVEGLGHMASGGIIQAPVQGIASVMEGINKLNIGGYSLENTAAGRQLANLIKAYSRIGDIGAQNVNNFSGSVGGALGDLGRGNIVGAAGNLTNIPQDVVRQITGGDIGKSIGGAVKGLTGGGIKISDEDLKTDIDYNPKDLQKFMDRIKPAAYDYKQEVQNSPLASKNRELGVMAQDLEKSKLGKEAVQDTDMGKVVDYDNLEPKMLASIAALNQRLKELESKK